MPTKEVRRSSATLPAPIRNRTGAAAKNEMENPSGVNNQSQFSLESWRLSTSLHADFCVDALEEALDCYGKPEIFNTDQGAQFTSEAFTSVLLDAKITISMDGKGRCMDNVFIERLWRSLKYEEVYLHAYETVADAKAGIGSWISFYNVSRPHQALGYRTPTEIFAGYAGAVDMMDNASRCPHSPQQTTAAAGLHLS